MNIKIEIVAIDRQILKIYRKIVGQRHKRKQRKTEVEKVSHSQKYRDEFL